MSHELIKAVREAGVVGAGGAGFPTDIKINTQVDTVIVNGSECEPLIQVDRQLMDIEGETLIQGLKTVMEITEAQKGIIGLKDRYQKAMASLDRILASGENNIQIYPLGDFYPAGDEQTLVYETTGRIVPEGGIPLAVNVVVVNVETLINTARAVAGIPVTEKYVTVTGAVKSPFTGKLPLGISIKEAVDLAGGPVAEEYGVINGGPMMGYVEEDLSKPITKTTKGLILLPKDHKLIGAKNRDLGKIIRQARDYCCQCVTCTDLCPRYLLGHNLQPHMVMRSLGQGSLDPEALTMAQLCCECGACEYFSCPMDLSPCLVNKEIKKQLRTAGIKHAFHRQPEKARSVISYRRIPEKRLAARLGLVPFEGAAPMREIHYLPEKITLPLVQHIGPPADPVVKPGDYVSRGQLVAARKEKGLGANIHSSISGRVSEANSARIVIVNEVQP